MIEIIVETLEAKGAFNVEVKHPKNEDRIIVSYYSYRYRDLDGTTVKINKMYGNSFDISGLELIQNNEDNIKNLVVNKFDELERIKL